jgi:GDP-L-fucose synthase
MDLTAVHVMVTGGAGFLGSYVCEVLRARGCPRVSVVRSSQFDLRTEEGVARALAEYRPECVIHLAAVVGGIGANMQQPGAFFYDNAAMGIHLIEGCRRAGVAKVVVVGTICAYPKHTPVPFNEGDLWNGYPEETNAPYGLAKKMLLTQCQAYRQQYGFNSIYLLPVNLYGPRDNFDLQTSHVIPAMIRKFFHARDSQQRSVTLWGDGSPTREFLHARDAAQGIVLAAERYEGAEPVNLGSGREIRIAELAALLKPLTGYTGTIHWDASKPNGQPRRCLDTRRARDFFGFEAQIPLGEGLRETVEWYQRHRAGLPQAA